MKRKSAVNLTVSLIAAALLLVIVIYVVQKRRPEIFVFENLSGPSESSVVPIPDLKPLSLYTKGSSSRLAILLTDTESSWLGLAHGLKSLGVPISVTTDHRRALKHRIILVYPTISGRVLEASALKALAAFPRGGGTLIGVNVFGGGLDDAWFGSISDFGAWWAARGRVEVDVSSDPQQIIVTQEIPERMQGLTLQIPAGFRFAEIQPEQLEVSQNGATVVLGEAQGRVQLTLRKDPS